MILIRRARGRRTPVYSRGQLRGRLTYAGAKAKHSEYRFSGAAGKYDIRVFPIDSVVYPDPTSVLEAALFFSKSDELLGGATAVRIGPKSSSPSAYDCDCIRQAAQAEGRRVYGMHTYLAKDARGVGLGMVQYLAIWSYAARAGLDALFVPGGCHVTSESSDDAWRLWRALLRHSLVEPYVCPEGEQHVPAVYLSRPIGAKG